MGEWWVGGGRGGWWAGVVGGGEPKYGPKYEPKYFRVGTEMWTQI